MKELETKHLTRREAKILALNLLANEWLPTAEAYCFNGYTKEDGTVIDFDEKSQEYITDEIEKIADSLKARAAKLKRK